MHYWSGCPRRTAFHCTLGMRCRTGARLLDYVHQNCQALAREFVPSGLVVVGCSQGAMGVFEIQKYQSLGTNTNGQPLP